MRAILTLIVQEAYTPSLQRRTDCRCPKTSMQGQTCASGANILDVAASDFSYTASGCFLPRWHSVCSSEVLTWRLLSSLSMEARHVAARFAAMDIGSLRSPGCEMGSGDRLRASVPRRRGNGKAAQVPRPADGAGTTDHHGTTGGGRGD
jgi:hypothetical protein